MTELAKRFWGKVDRRGPDDCWPWLGSVLKKDRRGTLYVGGKTIVAARIAWEVGIGVPPPVDMFVCHRCDKPNCVNPAHLWLGTNSDNIRDAASKGRLHAQKHPELTPKGLPKALGVAHGSAKLDDDKVREIRVRHGAGEAMRALSREFGVDYRAIRQVVRRETWRHV